MVNVWGGECLGGERLTIKFKVGVGGEEASEPRECSFDKVVVALIPDHQKEKEEECDENDDN